MKVEISEAELIECEKDLIKFVCFYEELYGQESMTFNLHALLHAVASVRKTGPLCFNSAFHFESTIFRLKRYVTGPNGMDRQMARKHLQCLPVLTGNTKLILTEEVKYYCMNFFTPNRLTTFYEEGLDDVTYFGKGARVNIDQDYQEFHNCLSYSKCIYNGAVYHSINYSRAIKTDDTIICLKSGECGRIIQILNINNECHLRLSMFQMYSNNPFEGISHIK